MELEKNGYDNVVVWNKYVVDLMKILKSQLRCSILSIREKLYYKQMRVVVAFMVLRSTGSKGLDIFTLLFSCTLFSHTNVCVQNQQNFCKLATVCSALEHIVPFH